MAVTLREEEVTRDDITRIIKWFEITHRDPDRVDTWHMHKVLFDPEGVFTDVTANGNGSTSMFEWIGNPLERTIPDHEHVIRDYEVLPSVLSIEGGTISYIHDHHSINATDASGVPTPQQVEEAFRADPADTVDFDFSDEPWFDSDVPSAASSQASVLAARRPANSIDTNTMEVGWQNRTKHEPFYSTNRLEYSTTVELCEGFIPGSEETEEECRLIVDQATARGIIDLTEFYNKQIPYTEEEQRALIDSAELEHYVDERPNSRVKLLVKIPAVEFEKLEGDLSFDQKVKPDFSHSVMLNSSLVRGQVDAVSSHFKKLDKEAKIQNIAFAKLDLIGESRRLKKFFSRLNRLLINNNTVFRESHDDSIEIGFNKGFSIEYVLYNSKSMNVGFEAFRKTDPINSPRTVSYISNLREVSQEIKSKTGGSGLTEFLLKYTYPRPEILPAGSNAQVPSSEVRTRNSQVMTRATEIAEPSTGDDIYTTSAELSQQTIALRNPDFVRQVSLQAESATDFVGDNLLSILPEIIERVDSVEDIFSEVLNKIDLSALAGFAATSALGEIPTLKSTISGAVGVFLERVESANKRAVNSMKQSVQSILDEVSAFDEVFRLMQNFSDLYGQYGPDAPSLPGAQINRLRFASVFGEYMATEGIHSPHALDDFIEELQGLNGDYSGTLQAATLDLTNISTRLSAYDMNIQNFLGERGDILGGIVEDLLPSGLGPLTNSLTREFSRIVDFYSSQMEAVFSDISRAVERNVSRISALPERVAEYISGLSETISGIQDEIATRIAILGSRAEKLMQAVTGFPDNFMNMVSSQIDRIMSIIDSKISEIMALKDSILSEVSDMFTNITDSIGNIDQFLEQFEIPAVEDLFQIPEIPDVMTLPSLPDDLPTFDIMSTLVSTAESAIQDIIQSSIVEVAKETIGSAIEGITSGVSNSLTSPPLDFGGMDINSTLGGGLGLGDVTQNQPALSSMLGQMTNMAGEVPSGTNLNAVGGRMGSFLGDVSSTLTPDETTSLLGGSPSSNTTRNVMNVLNSEQYSDLGLFFGGSPVAESKVIDFFRFLGEQAGTRSIDAARQQVQALSVTNNASIGSVRRDLLTERYGDSLSAGQIEGMVQDNSKKGEKKAFKLLERFFGSSKGSDIPAVLGGPGAIFPKNPPSVDYMTDRVLETMFESIVMFFNYAIHGPGGFVQSLSFKMGSRQVYEEIRRSNQRIQSLRPLKIAAGLAMFPPIIIPPFWTGDPREGGLSDETHQFEIMDSPLAAVKAGFESFDADNWDVDTLVLPHPRGEFLWMYRGKENDTPGLNVYEHLVEFPAPQRKPYGDNSVIEITAQQAIDPNIYGSPIPQIMERIPEDERTKLETIFASLATHDLKSELPWLNVNLSPGGSAMGTFLQDNGYVDVLKSIVGYFVERILESKVFTANMLPYTEDLSRDDLNPDAVSNWRLEPPSDRTGETQTTLIDLENLRRKTKKRYSESSMREGESLSDSMQKSIMMSSVEAIIRTQVVEFILMVLPVLDRFQKNDVISDEAVKYLKIKLRESCLRQDPYTPGYYENILREVEALYREDWETRGPLFNVSSGSNLPPPDDVTSDIALEYVIKETILKMSSGLRESLPISSKTPGTVYQIFLKKMLKRYAVVEQISTDMFLYTKRGYDEGLILEKYVQFERAVEGTDETEKVIWSIKEWKEKTRVSGNPRGSAGTIGLGLRLVYVTKLSGDPRRRYEVEFRDALTHTLGAPTDRLRTFRLLATDTAREDGTEELFHPLPLVSVTKSISIEDANADDFSFTPRDESDLINQMIEAPRFKLLFEQCFPLQRILSIMTIYTEVRFSSVASERLAGILDQTKSTLRSVFDGARNMNDYSYRDRNVAAIGGNPGLHSGRPRRTFPEGRSVKGFERAGLREPATGRGGLRRVITDMTPEIGNGD